jgi:uncharacterized cupin superfamily protein
MPMKIIKKTDAVYVAKPEGTRVTYFLFPEYEVHYNEQIPGSTQLWHHHEKVWETIYMIEGKLTAKWKDNGKIKEIIVEAGDLVEVGHTPHTFTNSSTKKIKFLVIKQVLKGVDNTETLKKDKVLD